GAARGERAVGDPGQPRRQPRGAARPARRAAGREPALARAPPARALDDDAGGADLRRLRPARIHRRDARVDGPRARAGPRADVRVQGGRAACGAARTRVGFAPTLRPALSPEVRMFRPQVRSLALVASFAACVGLTVAAGPTVAPAFAQDGGAPA